MTNVRQSASTSRGANPQRSFWGETEARPGIVTTELWLALASAATVVIASYISGAFPIRLGWALFAGIVAAYCSAAGLPKLRHPRAPSSLATTGNPSLVGGADEPRWLARPGRIVMSDGDRSQRRDVAGAASEQGKKTAERAASEASQVKDAAKDQAREVKDEVAAQARGLVDQAKTELRDQSEVQAHQVAQAIRRVGDQAEALAEGRARMLVRSRTTYARREAKPGR